MAKIADELVDHMQVISKAGLVSWPLRYGSAFEDPLLGEMARAIAQELQAETSAGRLFHGKYIYRESGNGGVTSGYRRIDHATIGLEYASDDPDGSGLGYITLRRLKSQSEKDPAIWIGFETGHDCLCGSKIPHEGPFTSVPAILTATAEPPDYLIELVKRAKTLKEDFVWPGKVIEKGNKS